MLGDDVLRRPRALRLPHRGLGRFAHQNALQRDMCPSATRFEGEILAMALDLMHAEAVTGTTPAGLVTSGGTGSILHAMLCYRGARAHRPRHRAAQHHQARDGPPGVRQGRPPVRPRGCASARRPQTTLVDPSPSPTPSTRRQPPSSPARGTTRTGRSTPIAEIAEVTAARGVGLRRRLSRGFLLPLRRGSSATTSPVRLPGSGVTSISADTHKYGYGLKGSSTSSSGPGPAQPVLLLRPDWSGGRYHPRHGWLLVDRPARLDLGVDGEPGAGRLPRARRPDLCGSRGDP